MGQWSETVSDLQKALGELYPDQSDARRIAEQAGLSTAGIHLNGSATQNWFRILRAAGAQRKLWAVANVALHEYPDSQDLQRLAYFFRQTEFVEPVSAATPMTPQETAANTADFYGKVLGLLLEVKESQHELSDRVLRLEIQVTEISHRLNGRGHLSEHNPIPFWLTIFVGLLTALTAISSIAWAAGAFRQ